MAARSGGSFDLRYCVNPVLRLMHTHIPFGEQVGQNLPNGRIVVGNENRQSMNSAATHDRSGQFRGDGAPTRIVNWKTLPLPSSLSTQIVPPINSASREQIASPRPVPPNLRVVDCRPE